MRSNLRHRPRRSRLRLALVAIAAVALLTALGLKINIIVNPLAAQALAAQPAAEIPPEVTGYAAAMKELLGTQGRTSVQPVFELGIQAAPLLQAVVQDLSDADFKSVQDQMQGFVVSRGAVNAAASNASRGPSAASLVTPKAQFFEDLAKRKGEPADIAFFAIYALTEPDSNNAAPAYIRRSDGAAGCTLYDGKLMVSLYRGWLDFRTRYPDKYENEAQGEIDSLDAELASGICACGSAQETAAGLQAFVDAFPDLPSAAKLRSRIAEIRGGHPKFRFNCNG